MLDNLLDYVPDGVFTVDADWRVTFFNRAAEQITGIKRDDAVGRRCCDVFRASICENACALKQTLSTSRRVVNRVVYIVDARGQKIPISISTAALKDERGRIIGGVESFRDLRLVEELHRELQQQNSFSDIIGRGAAMRQLFEILPQIAESDSAVLIEGAGGTGKELFARAVHNLSRRRAKRFVAINCGALPDNLLESELFGYKAGAFTDARRDKPCRFALAEGGTILLDEIYWLDRTTPAQLVVEPFLDLQQHGVFATRSPCRPNAIGLSNVRLLGVDGNRLRIGEVDILDETPLLDIKPYVPAFDCFEGGRVGWLEGKDTKAVLADERFERP